MKTPSSSRAIYFAWNALLLPFVPALACYTLWRRFVQKKSAASLRGQWGIVPREVVRKLNPQSSTRTSDLPTQKAPTRIWIHAVSVGETLAARPVARALKAAIPDCVIALSTTTDSGQNAAQAALQQGEIDATFYFPLDLPIPIRRALRSVQPHVFLVMETELWPNFLHLAKKSGAQIFLVNGRVSDNLQKRAPQMRALWRWILGNIDGFLMRSENDATRLETLGAPAERVFATGDVKLDALNTIENIAEVRQTWHRVLDIDSRELLVVAGSTHDGEETLVLSAFKTLRETFPHSRLLIAPRHIERAPQVADQIRAFGFDVKLRSEIELNAQNTNAQNAHVTNAHIETSETESPELSLENMRNENANAEKLRDENANLQSEKTLRAKATNANATNANATNANATNSKSRGEDAVILLDSVGELAQIYAAGDVSFVGGSLVSRGGHNVLEPVLCGVAVAFGPHIANFRDAAALVENADCGQMIHSETELAQVWASWLRDETWRAQIANRAEETLREHRGASLRVAEIVAQAVAQNAVAQNAAAQNAAAQNAIEYSNEM